MADNDRSEAYARYIEYLWEHDPDVRARIKQGIADMEAGNVIVVSIDDLLDDVPTRLTP